jgi:hypothetical protein
MWLDDKLAAPIFEAEIFELSCRVLREKKPIKEGQESGRKIALRSSPRTCPGALNDYEAQEGKMTANPKRCKKKRIFVPRSLCRCWVATPTTLAEDGQDSADGVYPLGGAKAIRITVTDRPVTAWCDSGALPTGYGRARARTRGPSGSCGEWEGVFGSQELAEPSLQLFVDLLRPGRDSCWRTGSLPAGPER